jgi:hypothetical protein
MGQRRGFEVFLRAAAVIASMMRFRRNSPVIFVAHRTNAAASFEAQRFGRADPHSGVTM